MKTSDVARHRGFESHPLRHREIKRTAESSPFWYIILKAIPVMEADMAFLNFYLFFAVLYEMFNAGDGLRDFGY